MTLKTLFKRYAKSEKGVVAIETAFIMPILVLLYVAMIDITNLVSMNRRVTQAAAMLSDVVTQYRDNIELANVQDLFKAVDLIMVLGPTDHGITISVEGYRNEAGVMTKIWTANRGTCTAAVDTGKMLALTNADDLDKPEAERTFNDIVVAKVCAKFEPWAGNILGTRALGTDSVTLQEVIMQRPRVSDKITCYRTSTHTATNKCVEST
jgi:hypothetical protein